MYNVERPSEGTTKLQKHDARATDRSERPGTYSCPYNQCGVRYVTTINPCVLAQSETVKVVGAEDRVFVHIDIISGGGQRLQCRSECSVFGQLCGLGIADNTNRGEAEKEEGRIVVVERDK